MPNKMLIDASHPEETRVVVTRGNRIEEFDFESQDKKQLKGNIYLARVTRVEPSLQAAFVEYGGNRHGFLAFSEIHPDYYQIPVADRQALLRAEAEAHEDEDEDEDGEGRQDRGRGRRRRRGGRHKDRPGEQRASGENGEAGEGGAEDEPSGSDGDSIGATESFEDSDVEANASDEAALAAGDEAAPHEDTESANSAADDTDDAGPGDNRGGSMAAAIPGDVISEPVSTDGGEAQEETSATAQSEAHDADHGDSERSETDRGTVEEVAANGNGDGDGEIESVGAEDALEEIRERRRPMRRHYKIQEVIKRRQILLVQVVKEERGNKGAALATYLSLAGRYSVLMPNTARGGGISRKITSAVDRKRLKDVVKDLDVPQGMGVILRTAGESRTKAEIKRDYEYLMRMWETVRNTTLESTAPALVYEEGSLIKRSVRDLYNKDIDEILVAGEEGYREAKDFMRMLMPSHAKVVQPYRDTTPIFARSGLEAQLDRMLQPQVTLKSGGYIIINQTEALVAIDVNSGRSTREHSIEDTALQTNLEAAEEVSRQLRLRDLAGLIVIDFIDMEENRNNRAVEKRLKDCLKNDRARIQVGRISHFGLLEMSRQRIRASVLESTMKPCSHCGGTGHVRSDSSIALHVVRAIEEFLLKDSRSHITVRTPTATTLYVLNHKRAKLTELEAKFGVTITLEADETVGAQHYQIFRGALADKPADFVPAIAPVPVDEPEEAEVEVVETDENDEEVVADRQPRQDGESHGDRDRKRRRRRRRGGRDRDHHGGQGDGEAAPVHAVEAGDAPDESDGDGDEADTPRALAPDVDSTAAENDRKKRRRGKRGGRRNRGRDGEPTGDANGIAAAPDDDDAGADDHVVVASAPVDDTPARYEAPTPVAESRVEITVPDAVEDAAPRTSRRRAANEDAPTEPVVSSTSGTEAEADKPKKGGWWQRKGFF
jgi:ribonuclease E